ncbi:MAG: DUF1573 domain-containing protein [Bacteroidota bacterium]
MKSTTLTALLFIGWLVGPASVLPAQLKFAETEHDLGEIQPPHVRVTAEFIGTNIGSEPVRILSAKPTSSNTTPNYPRREILPGEEICLTATLNPKGHRGRFTVYINVRDSYSERPHRLRLRGNIVFPKE